MVHGKMGYRMVLCAGMICLAAPAAALCLWTGPVVLVASSVVRGLGLAVVFVVGSPLVARLAPASRQAEALGFYGVIAGLAAVVGLPLGPWLVRSAGFPRSFCSVLRSHLRVFWVSLF